jgi:hypothetical protein
MLSVNENVDPTLLVLVRPPPMLTPPLADRFCHEVGGLGGRDLAIGFLRDITPSKTSCQAHTRSQLMSIQMPKQIVEVYPAGL